MTGYPDDPVATRPEMHQDNYDLYHVHQAIRHTISPLDLLERRHPNRAFPERPVRVKADISTAATPALLSPCRASIGDGYLGERYIARAILGCRESGASALRRALELDEAERPVADKTALAKRS